MCARSGSKGLRNKCVAEIKGKMVIEYSIEYSLSLGANVETVVSTDINSVINYCKANGIHYIKRDPELCTDESRIEGAIVDAIEKSREDYQYCSIVYGNIPIRYPKLFQEALHFLIENNSYDAVISMQNVEKYHPAWMYDYNETILPPPKAVHYRRQMLPQKMIHDGHTLIFNSKLFYKQYKGAFQFDENYSSIFGRKIKPLINNELIIDIDTEKDLILAEAIITSRIY